MVGTPRRTAGDNVSARARSPQWGRQRGKGCWLHTLGKRLAGSEESQGASRGTRISKHECVLGNFSVKLHPVSTQADPRCLTWRQLPKSGWVTPSHTSTDHKASTGVTERTTPPVRPKLQSQNCKLAKEPTSTCPLCSSDEQAKESPRVGPIRQRNFIASFHFSEPFTLGQEAEIFLYPNTATDDKAFFLISSLRIRTTILTSDVDKNL